MNNKDIRHTRTELRTLVFEHVYQYLINPDCEVDLIDGYAKDTFVGVVSNQSHLDQLISQYSTGFELDRLYKIDRAILLVATYEIIFTDIPYKIAINEALELAKMYSTPNSCKFVNGVLASITKFKLESDE